MPKKSAETKDNRLEKESNIVKDLDETFVVVREASNISLPCCRQSQKDTGGRMSDSETGKEESSSERKPREDRSQADESWNQPSTSTGVVRGSRGRKYLQINTNGSTSDDEEPSQACKVRNRKKVSLRITSTPTKMIPTRPNRAPRKRKGKKVVPESRKLRAAKMKLEECARVELDPDSSFDIQPEFNKEASGASVMREAETHPEFDTTSSSILSELRAILADLNQSPESEGWEGSDPNLTSILVNLVGEPERKSPIHS